MELERRSEDLPWEDIVRDHEALGVRYLLVHREGFGERGRTAAQQLMRLQEDVLQGRLRLVEDLGGTIVYELTAREPRDRESFREWPEPAGDRLDRSGWQTTAEPNQDLSQRVIDGDISTGSRAECAMNVRQILQSLARSSLIVRQRLTDDPSASAPVHPRPERAILSSRPPRLLTDCGRVFRVCVVFQVFSTTEGEHNVYGC